MSTVRIRSFEPGDLPGIVEAWNRARPFDPVTQDYVHRHILLDRNFDARGLLVATDAAGLIVGMTHGVRRLEPIPVLGYESDLGWIVLAFADPGPAQGSTLSALLTRSVEWLRGHGATQIRYSDYTPNYVQPGVIVGEEAAVSGALLVAGFTVVSSARSMSLNLRTYDPGPKVAELEVSLAHAGWVIESASPAQHPQLLELMTTFSYDWKRVARERLERGECATTIQVAKDAHGRIQGWAMFDAYSDPERFGPFGLSEACRGLGIGRVLLSRTLLAMRARGSQRAWFAWVDEGTAAEHLYGSAGFRPEQQFHLFSRTFPDLPGSPRSSRNG